MNNDEILQNAIDILTNNKILWRKLSEYENDLYDASEYSWYYSGDENYIIRYDKFGEYKFVKARSLKEALQKCREEFD